MAFNLYRIHFLYAFGFKDEASKFVETKIDNLVSNDPQTKEHMLFISLYLELKRKNELKFCQKYHDMLTEEQLEVILIDLRFRWLKIRLKSWRREIMKIREVLKEKINSF